MPFQNAVNTDNPIGVAGDFADANPRASVFSGEGGLVAGPNGVTVGKFAWVAADGITVTNVNPGAGAPDGFVHREQQARIDTFTDEASMLIPAGFPVTLHSAGSFLAVAKGAAATRGAAIYAANADGSVYIGAAPGAGGVLTAWKAKRACNVNELTAISTW